MYPIILHTTHDRSPDKVRDYKRTPGGKIKLTGGKPDKAIFPEPRAGEVVGFECANTHAPVSYSRRAI